MSTASGSCSPATKAARLKEAVDVRSIGDVSPARSSGPHGACGDVLYPSDAAMSTPEPPASFLLSSRSLALVPATILSIHGLQFSLTVAGAFVIEFTLVFLGAATTTSIISTTTTILLHAAGVGCRVLAPIGESGGGEGLRWW
ncbi:hypothetical protein CP532_0353 [Ophiocordyceps camponoti-leonardi (nom. inval.)]|nr:hypothetical protein CP532_0353 [Ophiocordyceps camponoti-leonardi (nom. inval.)]